MSRTAPVIKGCCKTTQNQKMRQVSPGVGACLFFYAKRVCLFGTENAKTLSTCFSQMLSVTVRIFSPVRMQGRYSLQGEFPSSAGALHAQQILLPPEIWMPRSRSSQMAYRRCQQLAVLSSSSSPATATLRVKGTRFIIPMEVTHSWGISA